MNSPVEILMRTQKNVAVGMEMCMHIFFIASESYIACRLRKIPPETFA
jgi:hypothetical protein